MAALHCPILMVDLRGADSATVTAAASATPNSDEPPSAEELDRPGEVENPFSLSPGTAQLVSYVLAANGQAREDEDLGNGGGAVILQTGVRFGLPPGWEGQIFCDSYLNAIDKGPDGDDPGRARAGLGSVTLRAKAQVLGNSSSEDGLALVPFVRFSIDNALTGSAGAEPGLIVPFNVDLEHGWELQGSTGLTVGHGDDGGHVIDWETQMSLEWHFATRWSVYVEPELDVGEGQPRWAMEQGFTVFLSRRWQLDLGFNTGLNRHSNGRFGYIGSGVMF